MSASTSARPVDPTDPSHPADGSGPGVAAVPAGRRAARPVDRRARVTLLAAAGLVLLHLGVRAWTIYTSWFTGDDFYFVSRMVNGGTPAAEAIQPQAGHIMPAGLY